MEKVSKHFQKKLVLDEITIKVEEGDVLCILGTNGSGKSTLLSILSGFLSSDSGTIFLNSRGNQLIPIRDNLETFRQLARVCQ